MNLRVRGGSERKDALPDAMYEPWKEEEFASKVRVRRLERTGKARHVKGSY